MSESQSIPAPQSAPASGGSGLGYRVERIIRQNGFDVFGVFRLLPSRFNGTPVIRFGTPPVATFPTREAAEAWKEAR